MITHLLSTTSKWWPFIYKLSQAVAANMKNNMVIILVSNTQDVALVPRFTERCHQYCGLVLEQLWVHLQKLGKLLPNS